MNLDGVLEVGVTKTVGESTVARMIALVTQAQAAKAPSERFSAWFGQRYSVAVMAGAIVGVCGLLLAWPRLGGGAVSGRDPAGGC